VEQAPSVLVRTLALYESRDVPQLVIAAENSGK
jgi:hypothetical protein